MSGTDLRADLGVRKDPEFDLTLPPGWVRHEVGDEARDRTLDALRARLMREHKPQLYAELRPAVTQAFDAMKRNGATAYFAAAEGPDTLWIPASIIATIRRAEPGENLDPLVRSLVNEQGATPLRDDRRTLRMERERTVELGTATVVNQSVIYLTPVPGTDRRRALQLVAGFGRNVETPDDDPIIVATKYLFDTCVSTLRWRQT